VLEAGVYERSLVCAPFATGADTVLHAIAGYAGTVPPSFFLKSADCRVAFEKEARDAKKSRASLSQTV
jgi:hypothetical protein